MRILDISMPITPDMDVYKDNPAKKPVITVESSFENGSVYESRLALNMHTGTHIDMPLHILENGASIEHLDLTKVVTKCKVFDFSSVEDKITKEHLVEKSISEGDFILLKTKNSSSKHLGTDFVYLGKSGAEYLRSKKIIGVGIDSHGIERSQPNHDTHKILLGSNIVILEGLRLREIPEGDYFLAALPLCVAGAEAAPVRAVLLD